MLYITINKRQSLNISHIASCSPFVKGDIDIGHN